MSDRMVTESVMAGRRCRARRTVPHPKAPVLRNHEGRVRYGMENLGRILLMVDWDDGRATLVFPSDVELVAAESNAEVAATPMDANLAAAPCDAVVVATVSDVDTVATSAAAD
jgi:hypothetical protein